MNKSLVFFVFIVTIFIAISNDSSPKKRVRVVAEDYHETMVAIHWKELILCSGKIIARNLKDTPGLLSSGYKIGVKGITGESLTLKSIFNDDPYLKKYEEDIYECVSVLEQPNEEMVALARDLKQQGDVMLVLASNMDEDSLELNKSKLKPELFGLFDIHFVANKQNGKKPNPDYYKKMLQAIREKVCDNDEGCMQDLEIDCVFVDDLKENVDGAEKADSRIKGFHFSKPSKSKKFRKRLIEINFLKPNGE